jgi:aryl-alcohol dehydrogenase-like predicted oxidoreductase
VEQRRLGSSGLLVSAVGFGCSPLAGQYGDVDLSLGLDTISRALDLGVTLLDTADVYGNGASEELVGRAIRGRRDNVVIATKFGFLPGSDGRPASLDCRPERIGAACDGSLRRLGVDVIDLWQLHRVDPKVPVEETIIAAAEMVAAGKVRYLGLSECSADDIRRAQAVHPIVSLQSEYSVLERSVEHDVLGVCEELGIGFLAFAPLVRGLLAGSLGPDTELLPGDARADGRFPRVGPEHLRANARLALVVDQVAAEHATTPARVALAWLLARRPWIVPIPGTKRRRYLEDNVGAGAIELTAEDIGRMDGLAGQVDGDRYEGGRSWPKASEQELT